MIGQTLGELVARLQALRGVLAALAVAFVVALLYGRSGAVGNPGYGAPIAGVQMGVYQRGVGMGWESAYSLWPLLAQHGGGRRWCRGTASWLLIRRREVRPGIEAMRVTITTEVSAYRTRDDGSVSGFAMLAA